MLIKNVLPIVGTCLDRSVDSSLEQSYAMGCKCTQLPGRLHFHGNGHSVDPFPVVGEDVFGSLGLAVKSVGNMPGSCLHAAGNWYSDSRPVEPTRTM